jgi:AbrB family looped-hinge helix DNA binding protein
MKTFFATITQRSQVTVPAEIRNYLGVGPNDRLTFVIDDGEVKVRAPKFRSIRDFRGSVKAGPPTVDFDDQIEQAIEEHVSEFLRKRTQE